MYNRQIYSIFQITVHTNLLTLLTLIIYYIIIIDSYDGGPDDGD